MINFINKIENRLKEREIAFYQILSSVSENKNMSLHDGELDNSKFSKAEFFSISIKSNGKIGKYISNDFSDINIDNIINQAIKNAEIVECDDEEFFHDGSGEYKEVKPYEPLMEKVNKMNVIEVLQEIESKAYQADSRINKVISTSFGQGKTISIRKNSLGLNLHKESSSAYLSLYLSAKDGEQIKSSYANTHFAKDEDFDIDKLVEEAVSKAVSKFQPIDFEAGNYSVVFDNEVFSSFLEEIVPIFYATNIQENKSKLNGKLGEVIASELLTIVDSPLMNGGFSTSAYDADGCPTDDKIIIKNGKLETYLYSLKSANKDSVKTTGNSGGNIERVFNCYVENGDLSKEELLQKLNDGVFIG